MITMHEPIKRSKELIPFSREHHEGLLFAWKLKQGVSKRVEPSRMAKFCKWFWDEHLQEHIKKEEKILPSILSIEHPMIQKMFDEHEAIKSTIYALQEYACYEYIERLTGVINYHIRFEERYLFKQIEQVATQVQRKGIEETLQTKKKAAVWKDEFWVK